MATIIASQPLTYNTNMALTKKKKDPAAVALGRKGGNKGGPARAAKLASAQRSESARRAVQARWAKSKAKDGSRSALNIDEANPVIHDASDSAVLALLVRIKAANNETEIRRLTDQLQRVIFHRQYENTAP